MQEQFKDQSNQANQTLQAPKKSGKKKAICILMTLLVVAALSFACWKWYDQIDGYKTSNDTATKQIAALESEIRALKSAQEKTRSTNQSSTESTLAIKEWGVVVSPATNGLSYVIKNISYGDQMALLNTTSTKDIATRCKGQIDGAGLVALFRYDRKLANSEIGNEEFIRELNGKFYYLWVAPDCNVDTVSGDQYSSVVNALKPIALSVKAQ